MTNTDNLRMEWVRRFNDTAHNHRDDLGQIIQKFRHDFPESYLRWEEDEDRPDIGRGGEWCVGPILVHRESDLIDEVNARTFQKELAELVEIGLISDEDFVIERSSHSLVGWVDHFSFRVVTPGTNKPSLVLLAWLWHTDQIEEYPSRDDDAYGEAEEEVIYESLVNEFSGEVNTDSTDWAYDLMSEGQNTNAIEACDNHPIIDWEWCREWLVREGLIETEEDDE